jgi:hypothetical protein
MTIGSSLFLIAAGAILKYAVHTHVEGLNLHTCGVVLMCVGALGLVLGIFLMVRGGSPDVPPRATGL